MWGKEGLAVRNYPLQACLKRLLKEGDDSGATDLFKRLAVFLTILYCFCKIAFYLYDYLCDS